LCLEVRLALKEVKLLLLVVVGECGLVANSLTLTGSGTGNRLRGRSGAVCDAGG
jgi:hypothetical protein